MTWQRFPLLRVVLAFALGIVIAYQLPLSRNFFSAAVVVVLALLTLAELLSARKLLLAINMRGIAFLVLFMALGGLTTSFYLARQLPEKGEEGYWLAQIVEAPENKTNSVGVEVSIMGRRSEDTTLPASAGCILYLQKTERAMKLNYGDVIAFRKELEKLEPPANPAQFDYRAYLRKEAIYYSMYLDSASWQKVRENQGSALKTMALRVRRKLLGRVEGWQMDPAEESVAKALLLGYREDIGRELKQRYASAGVTHVLAVSGLHVGIIYLIASNILFFLKRFRYGVLLQTLILLLVLWFYAVLTGLSPSVVRAATMFSFVALGSSFGRITSIYNTLLASALLLLAVKPTFLYDVGFQLSYAAVFGIVWLQPILTQYFHTRIWPVQKMWEITTVSIAAQLGTFPLAIFYFHQFPGLFLFSNWLILPLVTVVMHWGIGVLTLDGLMPMDWLVWVFEHLLAAMNFVVSWVEAREAFLLDELHIRWWEVGLLYAALAYGIFWLLRGRLRYALVSTGLFTVLTLVQLGEEWRQRQSYAVQVYKTAGSTVVGFYRGGSGLILHDKPREALRKELRYNVMGHWWQRDVEQLRWRKIRKGDGRSEVVEFGGKKFWFYDEGVIPPASDYWLVNRPMAPPPPGELENQPREVVITKRLWQRKQRWEQWVSERDISLFYQPDSAQAFRLVWE